MNGAAKKCRQWWRRICRNIGGESSNNNKPKGEEDGNGGGAAGVGVGVGGEEEKRSPKRASDQEVRQKTNRRPPARRLPTELLAELAECVPHHRVGLTKLVTSYSSCPVGLFGVHLSPQNGHPSTELLAVASVLSVLLIEKREKMAPPIAKWNKNELELYNKWKAESVHLITLLEEVKRLHASQ